MMFQVDMWMKFLPGVLVLCLLGYFFRRCGVLEAVYFYTQAVLVYIALVRGGQSAPCQSSQVATLPAPHTQQDQSNKPPSANTQQFPTKTPDTPTTGSRTFTRISTTGGKSNIRKTTGQQTTAPPQTRKTAAAPLQFQKNTSKSFSRFTRSGWHFSHHKNGVNTKQSYDKNQVK